ncbi:haloacid dehalogenase-like hydrolase domain-containing protein [Ditylenchus destructor]|uniref:Haloacid dehalogenase-like hydrolase domain-containing protein n=1 Tax=Ditylenchus destructor TaxID=166010 RepID=A0AAD4MZU4_9BILA|nr:haloacid dehalogenase-like hydrolase domain-containing protein [Ditylenchus destructor]
METNSDKADGRKDNVKKQKMENGIHLSRSNLSNTNSKYKAVLFDMGGVVIHYQTRDAVKSFGQVPAETKRLFEDYEIGLSCVEEVQKFVKGFYEMDENILAAIEIIRENGFKTGLLTNNGFFDKEKTRSAIIADTSMFDIIVESCRAGIRKPDPRFYQIAIDKLNLAPEECIFLDDVAVNCKAAEKVGMTAIHVAPGDTSSAIDELETLLSIKLK